MIADDKYTSKEVFLKKREPVSANTLTNFLFE